MRTAAIFPFKTDDVFLINRTKDDEKFNGIDKVNEIRSELPAITHIDNSCRVQTVSKKRNYPPWGQYLILYYQIFFHI